MNTKFSRIDEKIVGNGELDRPLMLCAGVVCKVSCQGRDSLNMPEIMAEIMAEIMQGIMPLIMTESMP
jgi:hypothetical protein